MTPEQLYHFTKFVYRGSTGEERFLRRIKKGEPNECWPWQGPVNKYGYGILGFSDIATTAHRVAYELENGSIGNTYTACVLHRCDNPPCCNPIHLFLGSRKDNIADMTKKGRLASFKGIKNSRAVLAEEQVLTIFLSDESNVDLGIFYGVAPTTIAAIRNQRNWKHLTCHLPKRPRR